MRVPPIARSFLRNSLIPLEGVISGSIAVIGLGLLGAALLPEVPAKKSAYLALGTAPIAVVAIVGYSTISQVVTEEDQARNPWEERIEAVIEQAQTQLVPNRPVLFLDELIAQRRPSRVQPVACKDCQNYVGRTFEGEKGANHFVCAMHPSGPESETCIDWEKTPVEYRLIRLQGVGFPNLWFARCEPGDGLNEIIQEAIPVSQDECDRLKRRYRLKSGTGLPGCIFKSRAATTVAAFKELMDSCCN